MKSAYELAMERLSKQSPTVQLSDEQRRQLADLDSRYAARLAEREITLKDEIAKARAKGDLEEAAELEQRLASERKKLRAELEQKKQQIRTGDTCDSGQV